MTKHLHYLQQLMLYLLHRVQLVDIWQLHRLHFHRPQFHVLSYMLFAGFEFSFHGQFQLYLSCIVYKLQILLLLHIFQQFLRYYSLDLDNSSLFPIEEYYSLLLILLQLLQPALLTSDYRYVQELQSLYSLLVHNDKLLLRYHPSTFHLQYYKYRHQFIAKPPFYILIPYCGILDHTKNNLYLQFLHRVLDTTTFFHLVLVLDLLAFLPYKYLPLVHIFQLVEQAYEQYSLLLGYELSYLLYISSSIYCYRVQHFH